MQVQHVRYQRSLPYYLQVSVGRLEVLDGLYFREDEFQLRVERNS